MPPEYVARTDRLAGQSVYSRAHEGVPSAVVVDDHRAKVGAPECLDTRTSGAVQRSDDHPGVLEDDDLALASAARRLDDAVVAEDRLAVVAH